MAMLNNKRVFYLVYQFIFWWPIPFTGHAKLSSKDLQSMPAELLGATGGHGLHQPQPSIGQRSLPDPRCCITIQKKYQTNVVKAVQ